LAGLLRHGETVGMAHETRLPQEILGMLKAFEHLLAWPLGGLDGKGELVIGRAPDCDVVIQEPSVSSRHATVRQADKGESCLLTDLDSRNGTFVNARRIEEKASVLFDGDALSFGDAQFLFLKAESFAAHLSGYRDRLGEASRVAR
jgi:FHA domain